MYDDEVDSQLKLDNGSVEFELESNDLEDLFDKKKPNEKKKKEKLLEESSSDDSSSDSDDDYDSDLQEAQSLGDLIWHCLADTNLNDLIKPIFECNLFQFNQNSNIIKISSSNLNFEFSVCFEKPECFTESNVANNSFMILNNDQLKFSIICQRVLHSYCYDNRYTFTNMFNNEFLADVKIKTSTGHNVRLTFLFWYIKKVLK